MTPESEVFRFGNGGLLTSTERVTVPVVLADHSRLLCCSVVESPVLSLLIGSSKTLEYNGRSQPLEDSVAGHYCVTLSPERYARLLKLENSPDPSTSRLRPRPTSLVPKNSKSKLASTLEIGRSESHGFPISMGVFDLLTAGRMWVAIMKSRHAPGRILSVS